MSSRQVRGPVDPVAINDTIKVRHRVQIPISASSSAVGVTEAIIASFIPGGPTAWPHFRILHIDVWGPGDITTGSSSLSPVAFSMSSAQRGDGATFTDWGTFGSQRANLHIVPNFDFRSDWKVSSATNVLFTLHSTGSSSLQQQLIVNVTLELRTVSQALPNFLMAAGSVEAS